MGSQVSAGIAEFRRLQAAEKRNPARKAIDEAERSNAHPFELIGALKSICLDLGLKLAARADAASADFVSKEVPGLACAYTIESVGRNWDDDDVRIADLEVALGETWVDAEDALSEALIDTLTHEIQSYESKRSTIAREARELAA